MIKPQLNLTKDGAKTHTNIPTTHFVARYRRDGGLGGWGVSIVGRLYGSEKYGGCNSALRDIQ